VDRNCSSESHFVVGVWFWNYENADSSIVICWILLYATLYRIHTQLLRLAWDKKNPSSQRFCWIWTESFSYLFLHFNIPMDLILFLQTSSTFLVKESWILLFCCVLHFPSTNTYRILSLKSSTFSFTKRNFRSLQEQLSLLKRKKIALWNSLFQTLS